MTRPNIITLILEDLDDSISKILEEYIEELEEYKFMYEELED